MNSSLPKFDNQFIVAYPSIFDPRGFGVLGFWGFGAWKNIFLHQFDDSRGMHDPNAREMGLQRPL